MPTSLRGLVAIGAAVAAAEAWRVEEREPERRIVGLVGAVLRAGQHGYAIAATTCVGEIDPLVRRHLELLLVVIPALDRADFPVVRRLRVRRGERKRRLQRRGGRLPVDGVGDLDAIAGLARAH